MTKIKKLSENNVLCKNIWLELNIRQLFRFSLENTGANTHLEIQILVQGHHTTCALMFEETIFTTVPNTTSILNGQTTGGRAGGPCTIPGETLCMFACQASLPLVWIINLGPVYPLGLFRVAGPLTQPFLIPSGFWLKNGETVLAFTGPCLKHTTHFLLFRVWKFVVCGGQVISERKQKRTGSFARQDDAQLLWSVPSYPKHGDFCYFSAYVLLSVSDGCRHRE